MSPTTAHALKWGLIIGLASLVWLYVAYYLGLHTNGIVVFQAFMLGWLVITVTGYILALRSIRRLNGTLSFWNGLRAGSLAAVVTALVAVLMQVGYYKVVHPEWPDFMVGQTREHFAAQGMPEAQVDEMVARARRTFTLRNYAIQSALTALITGVVLSGIIMLFLKPRAKKASPSPAT
jgi:hypothetical protein